MIADPTWPGVGPRSYQPTSCTPASVRGGTCRAPSASSPSSTILVETWIAGIRSRIGGAVGDGSLFAATAAGAPATGGRGADAAALGPGGPPGARRTRIRTAMPATATPPPPSSARSQARRRDARRSRRASREASDLIGRAGYRHGLGAVRENPGATVVAVPEDGRGRARGGYGGCADRQRDPGGPAGGGPAA